MCTLTLFISRLTDANQEPKLEKAEKITVGIGYQETWEDVLPCEDCEAIRNRTRLLEIRYPSTGYKPGFITSLTGPAEDNNVLLVIRPPRVTEALAPMLGTIIITDKLENRYESFGEGLNGMLSYIGHDGWFLPEEKLSNIADRINRSGPVLILAITTSLALEELTRIENTLAIKNHPKLKQAELVFAILGNPPESKPAVPYEIVFINGDTERIVSEINNLVANLANKLDGKEEGD